MSIPGCTARAQVGVNIFGSDVPGLQRDWGVRVAPCVDVAQFGFEHGYSRRRGTLADLCTAVLGRPLRKDLALSDWGRVPLSDEQQAYAAIDVLAPVKIYELLLATRRPLTLGAGTCLRRE